MPKKIRSSFFMFVCALAFLLPGCCHCTPLRESLGEAQQDVLRCKEKAQKTSLPFNPSVVFDNYSAHPASSRYYSEHGDSKLLSQAADSALGSGVGSTVLHSAVSRPQFTVATQDTTDALVSSLLAAYPDCRAQQNCSTHYTQASCQVPLLGATPRCRKTLAVSVLPAPESVQTVTLGITAVPHRNWWEKGSAVILTADLSSGKALSEDGSVTVSVSPLLKTVPCEGLQVSALALTPNPQEAAVEVLEAPQCNNHFQVKLRLTAASHSTLPLQAQLRYRIRANLPPQTQESWNSGCSLLEQLQTQGVCQPETLDSCVGGQETRNINGFSLTRPCWAKESTYRFLEGQTAESSCKSLQDKGCEQIDAQCTSKIGEVCAVTTQTYRCPEKKCVNTPKVVCGESVLCLSGDCGLSPSPQLSHDFESGVSALSSTRDASQHVELASGGATVFAGTPAACRDTVGDFSHCCDKGGWGQSIHLAHCSAEEKSLALSRHQGLTIPLGRYCAHHLPWPLEHVCSEYKQQYCVFGSKLARILQTQGRKGQLHRGFGHPEAPDCSGISPEQLQHIDLGRIDFSDFYADLTRDLAPSERLQAITARIQRFQQKGSST